jgi:signal transduction histidine kinase
VSIDISFSDQAPVLARHWLANRDLDPEVRDRAILLMSELVSNAVQHSGAGPESHVGIRVCVLAEGLRVEVTDPGPGFSLSNLAEGDRFGLAIVDRFAERWGVEGSSPTTVWFEVAGSAGS